MPKILAVCNINDNIISLKAIIKDAFPEAVVITALDGPKVIELAIETNPDVILLDIIMPGMDGFEVCRLLKLDERVRDIPVVFLTALKGDKENRIRAIEVGAEGFLSQPIDETELTVLIRAMVKIRAANEQMRDEKARLEKLVEERTRDLVQSQAEFKGIFENLQDAYFQTDLSGKFTKISPSAIRMYGFESPAELIGQPTELLYTDLLERAFLSSTLRDKGRIEDYVCQGKKKDGTAFWVSINVQLIRNDDGKVIGTEGLVRDISERIKAEKALKQSDERFQMLFNQAPLGYQSLDIDGRFIEVNQQWLDTLGFTREEVIGKWFGDFLSPDYKEGFRQRFPLFKAQGHIHSEFEMVHKNGSKLFIAFEGKIGYNPDGGFKQTHCILQDITQRKLAEEALTESEEKYSILFKNSPDSYLIISEGIFVDCNKATEIMLRGDRTQIIGQAPDEISPEIQPDGKKSSDSAAEKIDWAFENGKNTFEWMHRRFDGSDLYVEVSIAPMKLKGKLTLFTTWRDISARKLAEKALRESEAQFREFFEKAADAIFIADIETGMIVDVNEAATRLMNRTYEQLVGIHQSQLHSPVKEDYAKESFKKHKELVKQKLSSYAIENSIVRSGGIEVPVEILAVEVDYHGKRCLMGTFRDITERKKSEKEFKESEAKYRYMFQHNPQPMWIYDHDTLEILEVNEVSTKIYGYSREEFLSMTIKDIRPAEDIALMLRDVEESRLDENSHGEWRHLKKSGEIVNVEISAASIIFNGRKARHVLIIDITERKRAEEAIRKSESLLRTLIESAPFEVWARDKDDVGILENENHVRHFGSILGKKPDQQGISHQIRQLWDSNNRRVMNGEIVDDECVYLVDRVERTFHQILAPIIVDGSMEGITGFNIDITERKFAEELLRESEYFFRESQRAAFVGSYKFDLQKDFWTGSDVLMQIFGIDQSFDRTFKGWMDILHPDDRDAMSQYFQEEVVGKRQPFNKEYRIISQIDHETRWVLGIGKLNLDAEDNVVEMIGTIQDITERKLAEQARNETYEFNRSLLKTIPFGMDIVDEHGRILFQSDNLEKVFGKGAIGTKCWETYRDDQKPCNDCPLNEGIELARTTICETTYIFGGRIFEINHTGMLYDGKKAMLEIFQDITERKIMEIDLVAAKDKAEENDRLKSAFLANMSHEIRTPLNSIIGFSELLFNPDYNTESQIEFAQMINNSGTNLLAIISDIMDFSKIEAGQIQVNKSRFMVNQLISDIQREYAYKASEKGIELRLDPANPSVETFLVSDQNRIKQVLVNFVGNSIKFTSKGYIEIGFAIVEGFIQFHVNDTGIGISKDFHESVFERFSQVDSSSTRKYGGNGLGLAISKSLVEMLGGRIWMESEPGKGSAFYFTIPVDVPKAVVYKI